MNIPDVMQQTGKESFADYAVKMAGKYGLDSGIFISMLKRESGLKQTAPGGGILTGKAGELGIGQLKPTTAAGLGVDPTDPYQNIEGAAKYLKEQLTATGNYHSALAAYNQGLAGSRGKGAQAGKAYADAVLQNASNESIADYKPNWFEKIFSPEAGGGSSFFTGAMQNGGFVILGVGILIVALVMTGRGAAIGQLKEAIK